MPFHSGNGVEINYEVKEPKGTTEPRYVVLINGLADPRESWDLQVPDFVEAGFTVLTFDNRGIGSSSCPAGPYTAEMLADDAKSLVSALDISHFHLMGVSMGGMIAQAYALKYPDDLKSLTLACTYAAPGPFCTRMFAMWADMAPVVGVPFIMRDVLLWAFTTDFFSNPDRAYELMEVEHGMKFMTQTVPAYLAQLNVIQKFDVKERISSVKVPTLVLAGEQDILIPVSLSKEIHDAIPNSKWITVRGGHACMWEFADDFNKAFIDFLEEFKD